MAVFQTVTVSLAGLQTELQARGIDPASLDYRRALQTVSVFLGAEAKRCFASSSTPDGTPWPPFARTPSRRRGGASAKLLIDRGLLIASMSARQARGAVRTITSHTLEQGTNLDYARYQNFGTRTIPARTFLGITEAAGRRIEDLIADDVVRQLGFGP